MATSPISGGSIDVRGIVSQLMAVERQPLQALQSSASGIQTKLSSIGRIQGLVASFQTAARELSNASTWSAAQATSSDETALKAAAGADAVAGTYDVTVNFLAQRQTLAGPVLASKDTVVGGGTMRIQLGSYDAGTNVFTAKSGASEVAVSIPANATLAQVRDAINAAGAGVAASIVNDGSGSRLVIRGNDTGAVNGARITVTDDDANDTDASGLSALAFDPTLAAGAGRNLTQSQTARDAELVVSGITVTSATNQVTGVIENVSLDLRKQGTGALTVTVSPNGPQMKASIEKFTNAWNELNRTLADLTRYDPNTKIAGPLQGNNTVLGIMRQMRAALQTTLGGGDLTRLSDAGLEAQRDGSLSLKSSKLDALLATPDKLRALFAASSNDPALVGVARRIDTLATSVLGSEGAVTVATETLRSRQEAISDQRLRLEQRLTQIEQRLLRQYSALDSNMAKLNSATGFLSKLG